MAGPKHHLKPLKFLHPKYLPTWLGLGLLWLTTKLPYGWMLQLGTLLGWLSYYLMPARRRITRTNIRLCFPELSAQEQRQLTKQSFYDSSIAILESPLSWWGSDKKLRALHKLEGLEHLQAALKQGKGVILLGAHYTTLEISGRLLAYHIDGWLPTFKPAHNKLFNAVMAHARQRLFGGLLSSSDMRSILRFLQKNGTIWFAQDQDFGRRGSVFAPFMGVATTTLTMTSRLAKRAGAVVLPFYSERLPGKEGYLLRIDKALEGFPSGDDVADATAINRSIEEQVHRIPSQYLWGHRRFKTRPYGAPLLYAPKKDPALKRYGLLMPLLALPMLLLSAWLAFKFRDGRYFLQRLGLPLPQQQPGGLWFHAASVGEVNAVIPLIKAMHARFPAVPITLTTATPTGGETARQKLPAACVQHAMPLDWSWALLRFIRHIQPSALLIMETELWPKLLWNCYRQNIPLIIINGRLSQRSLPKLYWIRRLYCAMVQQLRFVFARSDTDLERFIDFGLEEELGKVMGNIKLVMNPAQKTVPITLGRPYVLLASSRDDEEWRIVEAWQRAQHAGHLLVIVPRHPVRMESIRKQLMPYVEHIAVRSKQDKVTTATQIYIADTLGELRGFIAAAEFVIMGGSFVPLGGQNILEVGQEGKAVIFGPHMDNFSDEAALFLAKNAAVQVQEAQQLSTVINQLLLEKDRCQQLGQNGQGLMQDYQHILDDYLAELSRLLPDVLGPAAGGSPA